MRKKIAIALTAGVAAATIGFGAAGTASAAPKNGGACVQEGLKTLRTVASIKDAAQQKIDYSAFAGPNGIRLPLAKGSFLSLGTVVSLHATQPELFAWCD